MPGPYHVTRASAAAATAINTAQAATNDSAAAAVGAITVPSDLASNQVSCIYGGFAASTWTLTSVGTIFAVRLSGNGVVTTHDIACNGASSLSTTPGDMALSLSFYLPLAWMNAAIPVIKNNQISVSFFQVSGVSLGTWSGAVTLVFV